VWPTCRPPAVSMSLFTMPATWCSAQRKPSRRTAQPAIRRQRARDAAGQPGRAAAAPSKTPRGPVDRSGG
jgi:hypothetical protein